MLVIEFSSSYLRAYRAFAKRSRERIKSIDKALRFFAEDPSRPSLNTEKLAGSDVWTIRIDKGNRLFFTWSDEGDNAVFIGYARSRMRSAQRIKVNIRVESYHDAKMGGCDFDSRRNSRLREHGQEWAVLGR